MSNLLFLGICAPRARGTLDHELDYRHAAGALSEELQVIASQAYVLLSSIKDDDPHRPAILLIDEAIKKSIILARKIIGLDDLPV